MQQVTILETGLANLASVVAAFQRLGAEVSIQKSPESINNAERLVVPGVGHFGAAMKKLEKAGLRTPLLQRIEDDRPTLGICLGLQIFGTSSEESPGVLGLGHIKAPVTQLDPSVISPQMGWNNVVPSPNAKLLREGYAYFANGYSFDQIPEGWAGGMSQYGKPLVAALEYGNFLGCQFHPELSGTYGEELIARWLQLEVESC